jgi:hypothetical protein
MPETSITTQSVCPPKTSTVSTSANPLPAKSGEEASIATLPADSAPLQSSVGANLDASGDSTQKHSGQSPKNVDMAASTAETSSAATTAIPLLQHQ